LQPGDVFILAGRAVRVERINVMECQVTRAEGEVPTVPRWNANKMPLTNKVAEEIIAFRSELRARLLAAQLPAQEAELAQWISERLACGLANARIILQMYAAQLALSDIPTADFFLVEEYLMGVEELSEVAPEPKPRKRSRRAPFLRAARHYFFHSLVGRAANEALSRVVALRLSGLKGGNAVATADDYGFVLTVTPAQSIAENELPILFSPDRFADDLHDSLSRSELLKYHFRNAAQTGMMVYRNYFGAQKPIRKVQWSAEVIYNVLMQHEPDHVLLREARRDAVHTYIDIEGALAYLPKIHGKPARLARIDRVPPLSFAMYATKIKEALMVEDPREMMERLFHLWWERIQTAGAELPASE
jgi:ATP-dependent Lhr-like helicase